MNKEQEDTARFAENIKVALATRLSGNIRTMIFGIINKETTQELNRLVPKKEGKNG